MRKDREEVYKVPEVANKLGYSETTIRNWCYKGILRCHKMGGSWLISRRAVDAVLSTKVEKQDKYVKEIEQSSKFSKHCTDLADIALALAENMKTISSYKGQTVPPGTNIIDGGPLLGYEESTRNPVIGPRPDLYLPQIDEYLAQCLLDHFREEYADLPVSWKNYNQDNIKDTVLARLEGKGRSYTFQFSPKCKACQEMLNQAKSGES